MTNEGLEILKKHEGLRLSAYKCPAGKWTIGYGHARGVYEGQTISKEQADSILLADVQIAMSDSLNLISSFMEIGECPRRDAIINMAFNMGYMRFSKFTTSLNYIRLGLWKQAAESLRRTKWYKDVKGRAKEVVHAIEFNKWYEPDIKHNVL